MPQESVGARDGDSCEYNQSGGGLSHAIGQRRR